MCVCTLTIVLQFHMHNMQGVSTHNHIAISFWISKVFMQHYVQQNMNSSTFPELQNVKPFHYISQVPYLGYSRVFLKMFTKLSQCMNYITVSDLVKTTRKIYTVVSTSNDYLYLYQYLWYKFSWETEKQWLIGDNERSKKYDENVIAILSDCLEVSSWCAMLNFKRLACQILHLTRTLFYLRDC